MSKLIIFAGLLGCSAPFPFGRTDNGNIWDTFENDLDGAYHKVSDVVTTGTRTLASATGSWFNQTSDVASAAIEKISESEVQAKDFIVSTHAKVSSELSDAERSTEDFIKKTYTEVSDKVHDAEESTGNFFSNSWASITSGFSSAGSAIGNFFSSSWNKVQTWWVELEDEVKDFIHFIL